MKMMVMISAGGTAATRAAVSSPLEDVVTSLEPATSGGDTKEYAEDELDAGDEDSDDKKEDAPRKNKKRSTSLDKVLEQSSRTRN